MVRVARLFVMTCLLGAALLPMATTAQGSLVPERLEVALWPEYDQRAMLVIYRVALPATTALPATVEVPIPARVGEPMAVAQQAPDEALILADHTLQAGDGEWAILVIQAQSTALQVEFYDALAIEGASRSYTFTWPAGWTVGELAFEVLQPVGASEMQIDPAPSSTSIGPNGLTYHTGNLGPQDGSAEMRLHVTYSKADAGLTVDSVPPSSGNEAPAISAAELASRPATLISLAPWLVAGLGVALLVVGAVLFMRSRKEVSTARRPRHRASDRGAVPSQPPEASTVFCHACGTPAGVGDLFCRKCGTRLRV